MGAIISVVDGEYKINAGSWTSANGVINDGDNLQLRRLSSASYATDVIATVTVGTYSTDFKITTKAEPIGYLWARLESAPAFTGDNVNNPDRSADGQTCTTVNQNGNYVIKTYASTSNTEISVGAPLYESTVNVDLYNSFTDVNIPNTGESLIDTFNFTGINSVTKNISRSLYFCEYTIGGVSRFNILVLKSGSKSGVAINGLYIGPID